MTSSWSLFIQHYLIFGLRHFYHTAYTTVSVTSQCLPCLKTIPSTQKNGGTFTFSGTKRPPKSDLNFLKKKRSNIDNILCPTDDKTFLLVAHIARPLSFWPTPAGSKHSNLPSPLSGSNRRATFCLQGHNSCRYAEPQTSAVYQYQFYGTQSTSFINESVKNRWPPSRKHLSSIHQCISRGTQVI